MDGIKKIEMFFPAEMVLSPCSLKLIRQAVRRICRENKPKGMELWPSTEGYSIFDYPLTAEEEKTWKPNVDLTTYQISCSMRPKN